LLTLFGFPAGGTGLAAVMGVSEDNLRATWGKAGWDCQRRSNSLAGGFDAEVIPYLDADVIP
ncbi:MAG: hypothetical protein ACRDZ7_04095, partial [Acidimicrobiia bacterium]